MRFDNMWRTITFLITTTLLAALISSSFLPAIAPFFTYLLLNLTFAFVLSVIGSYRSALMVCLFGGLFENLFGTKIIGLYSTFYSFVILFLIYMKKHMIDNFISSLFVYVLSLYAYFVFFQKIWYMDFPRIAFGVFINVLVALLLVFFLKKR